MFVTIKRWCFDFATLFCQYQVCLKCRKLVYESFPVNENSSAMSDNERLHLFAKDEKEYKTIGKGVKFQDITPITAKFTNTIANGINNSYPF